MGKHNTNRDIVSRSWSCQGAGTTRNTVSASVCAGDVDGSLGKHSHTRGEARLLREGTLKTAVTDSKPLPSETPVSPQRRSHTTLHYTRSV